MSVDSTSTTTTKKIPTVAKVQEMIDSNNVIPNIGYWNKTQIESIVYPYKIVYGNGIYIVHSKSDQTYSYSTDLVNWTQNTILISPKYIIFVNNKFYAFSEYSKGCYSEDGINWTLFDTPFVYYSKHLLAVCHGKGYFVGILGYGGHGYYSAYSENGSEWIETAITGYYGWGGICYGNDMFVMVDRDYCKYSYDGINWSEKINLEENLYLETVQFVNDKFIIYHGTNNTPFTKQAYYSYDGINWTAFTFNVSKYVKNIVYGDGIYIAITDTKSESLFSLDGINWHKFKLIEEDTYINQLEYINNKFIGFVDDSSSPSYNSLITPNSVKFKDYVINNCINVDTLLNVDKSVQPPKYSMKPFDSDLSFSDSATTTREIKFQVGGGDYGRIACGATGNNAGWLEIATAHDKNEPIYTRQYSGEFTDTEPRTLTLLDSEGNTTIPGNLTVAGTLTIGDNTLIDIIYPVGSVFTTTDETQLPGTLYSGTTWESITTSLTGIYMYKRTA